MADTPDRLPPPRSPAPPPPVVPSPRFSPAPSGHTQSVSNLPPGVRSATPWQRLGAYLVEAVLVLVTLGIGWVVWALMIAGEGQTPAKKLLGLRVIGADTLRPIGLGRMFWVRGFVAGLVAPFAIVLTLGILLFMPFWDKRNQNVWDKVSNTYVVSDPHNAWERKPDLRF